MNYKEKLELLLDSLVTCHVQSIKSNTINNTCNVEENFDDSEDFLKWLSTNWNKLRIRNANENKVKDGIQELIENKKETFDSINTILFVTDNFKPQKTLVPNVYDLILFVLYESDIVSRREHFHHWVSYYYEKLSENLKENNLNIKQILPKACYEALLKKLLPYAKIDIITREITKHPSLYKKTAKEINVLASEIIEFITCPKILREDCYAVLNKIIKTPYELNSFKLVPILDSAGTLGEYYTLTLLVLHGMELERFRFFAKYLPSNNRTNEDQKKLARDIFHKEVFFYSTFIPRVIDLGFGDIVNFAPKFYFGRNDDVLVLEDLSVLGYRMSDIRQPGSFEWLLPIVKNLAKLHACSILLEEKLSEDSAMQFRIDEEYGDNLIETLVIKENILTENSMKTVVNYLIDKFPDIPQKFSIEEFKRKARLQLDLIYTMVQRSHKYRNVICHGDLWASNILFKENITSKSIASYIIDFQLVKYCLPTYDLMVVIYTNTSKEVRENYKDQLLEIYYKDLTEILAKYGVDINDIYDKETFRICCEMMKSTGIGMGVHLVQTFVTPDHISFLQTEEQDIKTEFLIGERWKFLEKAIYDEPLRSRVRDLIVDLYNTCIED